MKSMHAFAPKSAGIGVISTVLLILTLWLTGCLTPKPLERRAAIELDRVPIQYLSGRRHTTFSINETQWEVLRGYFDPPAPTPREERHAIRHAIAMMERIAGGQTPTHLNLGRNQQNPLGAGWMDCRDESTNTRRYLTLFDQHQLLHWHEIMTTAHRTLLHGSIHNSATIRDRTTQEIYVVDSWYLDNGNLPFVQLHRDWLARRPFPEETP